MMMMVIVMVMMVPQQKKMIRSFTNTSLFGPCLVHKSYRESVEQNVTLPVSLYGVDMKPFHKYDNDDNGNDNNSDKKGSMKDRFLPFLI